MRPTLNLNSATLGGGNGEGAQREGHQTWRPLCVQNLQREDRHTSGKVGGVSHVVE